MKRLIHCAVNLDDIPDEHKHGDCFVAALNQFLKDPERYTLVHGVVSGQGPLEGVDYCHAWVLDGDTVIDNTLSPNMRKLPKMFYYAVGNIHITREYDFSRVLRMMDKYGTYGPWDKVFDAYP